jgi:hypothetical protein
MLLHPSHFDANLRAFRTDNPTAVDARAGAGVLGRDYGPSRFGPESRGDDGVTAVIMSA